MKFKLVESSQLTEANIKSIQNKLKKMVNQWMTKYNKFYEFWRNPQFSDSLSSSLGVIIYPKDYEKARMASNAIQAYINDLGFSTWGSGAERTNPGVVNFHINYENDRPKSNAYTYSYGYKYEDLDKSDINESIDDAVPTKIRWYYDRYTRSWIIQLLDELGYEIKSEYCGNKEDRNYVIDDFKATYNITDARKYSRDE